MKTRLPRFENFRYRQISLLKALITLVILLFIIFWQYNRIEAMENHSRHSNSQVNTCPPPEVVHYIMSDYRFTKPLLISEVITERDENEPLLNSIKAGITEIINQE